MDIAKRRLYENGSTLVIVKGGKLLYESSNHGIRSLVEAIEKHQEDLQAASMADSLVGRAAALLSLYAGVTAIYAATLSEKAREVLIGNGVELEFVRVVSRILNRKGDDFCPFEKAVLDVTDPARAFERLRDFKPN